MQKNLLGSVADLLGVELGEEFVIENADRKETVILAADGLHVIQPNGVLGPEHGKLLSKVLQGLYEVKKKPWEPKYGEEYWTIIFFAHKTNPRVKLYTWEDDKVDFSNLCLGLVYRTQDEAESHLVEDFQKLIGKKPEETGKP